jgi:hypothetical protein
LLKNRIMAKKKEIDEEVDELNEEIVENKKEKKEYFIIEEYDFKMESSRPNDTRFFDLYFMHTINKGKKDKERKEFKLEGYGFKLETCLKRICAMRSKYLDKKEYKSFKEFVTEYQKQVKEVKALFDLIPQDFD